MENSLHKYPIGSLVLLNLKETNERSKQNMRVHIAKAVESKVPLWVVSHDCDTDGSPLYSLSLIPFDATNGDLTFSFIKEFAHNQKVETEDEAWQFIQLINKITHQKVNEIDLTLFQ